jgi:hypothetical protein
MTPLLCRGGRPPAAPQLFYERLGPCPTAASPEILPLVRQAFVHEATLDMEPEADERAPGAAVTVALCGHWDHEPPCPLSPHYVHVDRVDDELRLRVLFAVEPEAEGEVRRRIERALAGQWRFPDGFTTPWQLRASGPGEVSAEEADHAEHLTG